MTHIGQKQWKTRRFSINRGKKIEGWEGGDQQRETKRWETEGLAVAGHGCRRGYCGMQLQLAWTLSVTLRPGHEALSAAHTHMHSCTDVRKQADQTQGHSLFLCSLHENIHTHTQQTETKKHWVQTQPDALSQLVSASHTHAENQGAERWMYERACVCVCVSNCASAGRAEWGMVSQSCCCR